MEQCDVHLKPSKSVRKLPADDLYDDLRPKFPGYSIGKYNEKVKGWLLDGPSKTLPHDVQQAVQERRKQMVRFLRLGYTDSKNSAPDFTVFNELLAPLYDGYECKTKMVTSKDSLFDAIRKFLTGTAKDVDMPVILVTGKGQKQGDQLNLHFGKDHTSADAVFHQYKDKDVIKYKGIKELRMVFCCYNDRHEKVWFSNALPPATSNSEILEFEKYHYAIIKDGPKNKNIQKPSGSG